MIHLTEKVAIVTGGSRGLGRGIALKLASLGATVVVNYRSNETEANTTVTLIQEAGGNALAVQADVTNAEDVKNLIKETKSQFGRIDILVNNAGITQDNLLMMMKEDQWNDVISTNLTSVFNCSKAVLRPMLKGKQGGRIINITSISGLVGQAGQTNYSASKAGIIGFTKALAKEIGGKQVTVNAVAPGIVMTELTESMKEEWLEQYKEVAALGRLGTVEDPQSM